jgi:predicted component of type VI protein secretion system
MSLTIKVLNYKGQSLPGQLLASFDRDGGTLGRSSENHFILPDPEKFVSHLHATIHYENGCYYLKDVSSNGTLVSNKNLRVHRVCLEGAGIQDMHFFHREEIPELMRTDGALFREAIAGLVTILRGRTAAKSHIILRSSTPRVSAPKKSKALGCLFWAILRKVRAV